MIKDKKSLVKLINDVHQKTEYEYSLIEKDYYVYVLLKELNNKIDGLLFKGGTCLSQCYKLITRFSEDIDLSLNIEHFTQSNKRSSFKKIILVCENLGFVVLNKENILKHTHSSYNNFIIDYHPMYKNSFVKDYIQLEMVFFQKSFPTTKKYLTNSITNHLYLIKDYEFIKNNNLEIFEMTVQSLERTCIDKVFAVCDYFLRKIETRESRHLYDLYYIIKEIDILNDSFKELVKTIRLLRQKDIKCVSSFDNVNINKVLKQIIKTKYFMNDYNNVTKKLLYDNILDYDEVIKCIDVIIKSKSFI